jgi:hypothetical protein
MVMNAFLSDFCLFEIGQLAVWRNTTIGCGLCREINGLSRRLATPGLPRRGAYHGGRRRSLGAPILTAWGGNPSPDDPTPLSARKEEPA